MFLLVKEALQDPAGLGLDKVAIFVSLDGQDPAPSNKVLALYLPEVDKLEDVVVNPGLILSVLGVSKVLKVLACLGRGGFLA